jgi:AbrB family looped-hinge helix DNA binding protein
MAKRKINNSSKCCGIGSVSENMSCCKVDSIIPIDARGQIVLPKDLRERAGIKAGDKFAVISWQAGGKVSCISLVKTEDFADIVKNMLGPMMGEISKQ